MPEWMGWLLDNVAKPFAHAAAGLLAKSVFDRWFARKAPKATKPSRRPKKRRK